MPVAHLHVVAASPEQVRRLGAETTDIYAAALESPVERTRVYVVNHQPHEVTVGGASVAHGAPAAPFFTALVFAGRPAAQRHEVLRRVSTLLAEVLGVDLSLVRGRVIPVDPQDWGIGGVPASVLRAAEIAGRAAPS